MSILNSSIFSEIWPDEPLLIFDTNSINDLYRNAPDKSKNALSVLKALPKEQIFIPNHVYTEYQKTKSTVVRQEHKKISNVKENIETAMTKAKNTIEKNLHQYKRHGYPSISDLDSNIDNLVADINELAQNYVINNESEITRNKNMLRNDEVEPFVNSLFQEGSVGPAFSFSELIKIYSEGETRYKLEIPPGYKDKGKDKTQGDKLKKFGDLIIWKQALIKAKESNKNAIYVTSDKKEWIEDNGQKYPDPSLIEEFKEYSNMDIYFSELNDLIIYLREAIQAEEDKKEQLYNLVSLNDTDILDMVITNYGQELILEGPQRKLTNYLIHSGELQEFLNDPQGDVEINSYGDPDIDISSISIEGSIVTLDGEFVTEINASIEEIVGSDTIVSIGANVEVSGVFTVTVEVDESFILEEESITDDAVKLTSVQISAGGYEVIDYSEDIDEDDDPFVLDRCDNCKSRNTSYFMSDGTPVCEKCSIHYSPCPSCGHLFSEPFSGPVCDSCLPNWD